MNDAFKELEVAGWREPGRGAAYDAVVGRVTARVAEPLLDAVGVRAGTSLLDVATGTGHVASAEDDLWGRVSAAKPQASSTFGLIEPCPASRPRPSSVRANAPG